MNRSVTRLIGMLLLAMASLPATVLAEPSITVSPDPAPIGTRVSIRGTGFPADTLLALTIATDTTPPEVLITIPIPTDEDGNFRAGLTTPATGKFAAGKHIVTVTRQGSGEPLATTGFTLTGDTGPASSVATANTGTRSSTTTTGERGGAIPTLVTAVVVIGVLATVVLLALWVLGRARARTSRAS